jgi:polyphosphate kinase 2
MTMSGKSGTKAPGGKDEERAGPKANAAGRANSNDLSPNNGHPRRAPIDTETYEKNLRPLQVELVKLQEWVRAQGLKVVVLFEGRDAAGKGGTIKALTEPLNPRYARVVALPAPTEREHSEWYFKRYVAQLPAAGEIVFFDRSWYNRAGVERVMGFCTNDEYNEFVQAVGPFERLLVDSGHLVIKYWLSISDEEQERRFERRMEDPRKRWKLSPMDLEARSKWVDYSRAKDEMFRFSDTTIARWWVVNADDKRRAHLAVIRHFLGLIPYQDLTPQKIELPKRQPDGGYVRPPMTEQHFIPDEV